MEFLYEGFHVREGLAIRKSRKTVMSDDSINLGLGLLLYLREKCHSQEHGVHSGELME